MREAQRARIVLLAAAGLTNKEIATKLGAREPVVGRWRKRFAETRLAGLTEKPGRGRKPQYGARTVKEIVDATVKTTPAHATHWSTRTMAQEAGVSHTTVRRIWNVHQLKPHLVRTFKLSNDKRFTEKLRDIVGLYLNPPEHALVLCVDETSQIQALDRTQPGLPLKKGRCGTMTHDDKRNGTTTLFAALNMADGTIIGRCMKRHRHQEYLKFLRQLDTETPEELDLHLIVDNYATHKHATVKRWLETHPRFHQHFIPTSSSWLNMVERFFRELTDKRIRRGVFRSVDELIDAIEDYLSARNDAPTPFVWTKTADAILEKLAPLYAAQYYLLIEFHYTSSMPGSGTRAWLFASLRATSGVDSGRDNELAAVPPGLHFAEALGANVAATVRSAAKAEFAKHIGADLVIDIREEDSLLRPDAAPRRDRQ